jgi:hypothetical protein
VIGDAPRDVDAGKAAGCRAILVKNGSIPESPASREPGTSHADYEVESLAEAMEIIARHPAPKEGSSTAQPVPINTPHENPGATETAQAVTPAEEARTEPSSPPVQREPVRPTPVSPAPAPSPREDADDDVTPELTRGKSRTEILLGQILDELRRRHEHPEHDFSVSKLMAGVVQVLALAAVISAYGKDPSPAALHLLVAIFLQTFTISLLIMGRQK